MNKFNKLLKNDKLNDMFIRKENLIDKHKEEEFDKLKINLVNRKVSFKDFNTKRKALDKWVSMEKKILKREKKKVEKGWKHATDYVKRTDRDITFMKKLFSKYGLGKNLPKNKDFVNHPYYAQRSFEKSQFEAFDEYLSNQGSKSEQLVLTPSDSQKIAKDMHSSGISKTPDDNNIKIIDNFSCNGQDEADDHSKKDEKLP